MKGPNQLDNLREDVNVGQAELLRVPRGTRTEEGLRHNILVGVQYIAAWLGGLGCVPLYNLMEDAATAEISRAQVWQWIHHGATLEDGAARHSGAVPPGVSPRSWPSWRRTAPPSATAARTSPTRASSSSGCPPLPTFEEFLTLPAYEALNPQS